MIVTEDGALKDQLTLWAADFLLRYKPDRVEDIDLFNLAHVMIDYEEAKGVNMFDDPTISKIKPTVLYRYAEAKARTWQMPITRIGLTMAVFGCYSPQHIDMVLAVLYKTYKAGKQKIEEVIDGKFVWEMFKHGTPSKEFLSHMWELQKGDSESGLVPLLEKVKATDF